MVSLPLFGSLMTNFRCKPYESFQYGLLYLKGLNKCVPAGGGWVGRLVRKLEGTTMESKIGFFQGYVLLFGGSEGGPMVTDGGYTSPGHIRGGLRQKNVSYDNFRKA